MANREFEDENTCAATENTDVETPRLWWRATPKRLWLAGNLLLVALLLVLWFPVLNSGALIAAPASTATSAPIHFVTPTLGQSGANTLSTDTPFPTVTNTPQYNPAPDATPTPHYEPAPTATSTSSTPVAAPTATSLAPSPTPTNTPQSQS